MHAPPTKPCNPELQLDVAQSFEQVSFGMFSPCRPRGTPLTVGTCGQGLAFAYGVWFSLFGFNPSLVGFKGKGS